MSIRKFCINLLLGLSLVLPLAAQEMVDQVVAIVGESPIYYSDIVNDMVFYRAQTGDTRSSNEELFQQILNQMIEGKLLLAQAEREEIEFSEKDISQEAETAIARLQGQFSSEEEFHNALEQEGLTLNKLRQRYRREIQERKAKEQLFNQQIRSQVSVEEEDIRRYYETHQAEFGEIPEQFDLSMLFLQYEPNAESEAAVRQRMLDIREEILAGKDFAEAAKTYSEGPSAPNGGNLGSFSRGTMYKPFEDAAFTLDIDEISQPVRTPVGYHLIEVLEKGETTVKARHILLKIPISETDKETIQNQATEIQTQANNGSETFADLVERYSDDEETKANEGKLGLFTLADIPQQFAPKIKDLAAGQVSAPILTEEGVYLLRLNEIHEAHLPDYEELKPKLKKVVLQEKTQQQYKDFIENLKKKIYMRKFI